MDDVAMSGTTPERLVITLYLFVCGCLVSVVLYYRLDDGILHLHPFTPSIWICVTAIAVSIVLLMRLLSGYRRAKALAPKAVRLSFAMGLVSITLTLILGEIIVRFSSESDPAGPSVGGLQLLPRDWQKVVHHRRSRWEQHASDAGVFVFDSELGWTVGPNRKGVGGAHETIYSNSEGARVGAEEFGSKDHSIRIKIALLGNSYVFGSEVDYEKTWGFRLEDRLGAAVRVQNFGVPAYGVDQAYLRYLKEVRDMHPDIAILGLISHDLIRTTMVYYAIGFPGGVVPGAKPRFIMKDGQPTLLNVPLVSPEIVYKTPFIKNLPYVDYDRSYRPAEWQPRWYEFSYLLRFGVSCCTPYGEELSIPPRNDETVSLNGALLHSFIQTAISAGTTPIVVFFPYYTESRDAGGRLSGTYLLGVDVLKEAGVDFIDMTDCIDGVNKRERFTIGWHYTPWANSVIADCLLGPVNTAILARGMKS